MRFSRRWSGCGWLQVAGGSPWRPSPIRSRRRTSAGQGLADRYGLRMMTHIAETRDELRIVRRNATAARRSSTSMRWGC